MKYNEVILRLRKMYNYTQTFVAKELNISQRAYAHYETGEHEPKIESLIKLSKLYHVSIDAIVGIYDIPGLEQVETNQNKRGRKPDTTKE